MMGRVGYANTPNPQSITEMLSRPAQDIPDAEGLGTAIALGGAGSSLAQTAFHGSPYRFNKFDASKIGTGEGAQTYGHGMYFAENPKVAQEYAQSVARQKIDEMARLDKPISVPESNVYKVDIPDRYIPKMLDWDKPLNQQPPSVQQALMESNLVPIHKDAFGKPVPRELQWSFMTGGDLIQHLKSSGGNLADYSTQLGKLGIPGITYLDQFSRQPGMVSKLHPGMPIAQTQPTSNYVIFDPKKVRILNKE